MKKPECESANSLKEMECFWRSADQKWWRKSKVCSEITEPLALQWMSERTEEVLTHSGSDPWMAVEGLTPFTSVNLASVGVVWEGVVSLLARWTCGADHYSSAILRISPVFLITLCCRSNLDMSSKAGGKRPAAINSETTNHAMVSEVPQERPNGRVGPTGVVEIRAGLAGRARVPGIYPLLSPGLLDETLTSSFSACSSFPVSIWSVASKCTTPGKCQLVHSYSWAEGFAVGSQVPYRNRAG